MTIEQQAALTGKPSDRLILKMADVSDYTLANRFYLLERKDIFEFYSLREVVFQRLIFLKTHYDQLTAPNPDLDGYAELDPRNFALWMANDNTDPFDGRYDKPNDIGSTVLGHLNLDSFIEKVRSISIHDLSLISIQTAVKERLRYYSRQLYLAIHDHLDELKDSSNGSEKVPE